jgi:transcription initiation factor TFIIIB Brf1 subunit/transcription initiation factor TFIIB
VRAAACLKMATCYHCYSTNVKDIKYETICTDCGTVQAVDYIVRDEPSRGDMMSNKPVDFTDIFCETFNLPTVVNETSRDIYKDLTEFQSFKGARKEAILISCIYYAQGVMYQGRLDASTFPLDAKCHNLVGEFVASDSRWSFLKPSHRFEEYMNKVDISSQIRKKAHGIMDKVKNKISQDIDLSGVQEASIYASIVFMSIKQSKEVFPNSKIQKDLGVSITTLKKVSKFIEKLI